MQNVNSCQVKGVRFDTKKNNLNVSRHKCEYCILLCNFFIPLITNTDNDKGLLIIIFYAKLISCYRNDMIQD